MIMATDKVNASVTNTKLKCGLCLTYLFALTNAHKHANVCATV